MPYKDSNIRREKARIRSKIRYASHKIVIIAYQKEYQKTPKVRAYQKQYSYAHKKQKKEYNQLPEVKKKSRERAKKWYKSNKEQKLKETKNYYQTHREKYLEKTYKRRRELGFNLIWEPNVETEPMVNHHINKKDVVRIPERIHKSIYHNIRTGRGMIEINNLTKEYVLSSLNMEVLPQNLNMMDIINNNT